MPEWTWLRPPAMPLDLDGPATPFRPFDATWVERPGIELFAAAAEAFADRVACEDGTGRLTFGEIWRACRHLAAEIEARVPPGQAVGVLLPNEAAYPVAVLACLAAGRTCVMIDRHHPPERVGAIVHDAGLGAAIVRQGDIDGGLLLPAGTGVIAIDPALAGDGLVADRGPAAGRLGAGDPAFVVYTSGSTGRPKGIALSQRAVLHRALELVNAVHLAPEDRVLSLASPSTIGGLQQIFEVMLSGASLVKLDLQQLGLGAVMRAIEQRRLTMMFSTPAVWRSVSRLAEARRALASLRCVQTSGDALLAIDLERMRAVLPAGCRILSVYGATEAPALIQWFVPDDAPVDAARVPAGYALDGFDFAVLAEDGHPVSRGEAGELVVRSRFMSAGIWRAGALHPGPFEADPAGSDMPVYRTGDLVRWRSDGLFVTLGRRDRQVKVLGNRVELAEIETGIRRVPGVAEAAVVARRGEGEARLLAFVVAEPGVSHDLAEAVRAHLAAALPAYMRPSAIRLLPELPLLPGRKVDEEALLALAGGGGDVAAAAGADDPVTASRRSIEMVEVAWRWAIGRPPRPGRRFEEAGGDSLRLLHFVFELERLAGRALPIERFALDMTGAELARELDLCRASDEEMPASDRPVLFLFPPAGGGDVFLAEFRALCLQRFSVRQVAYPDLATLADETTTFETIAAHTAGQVERWRPAGPLLLIGYSDGGHVAWEAARQLAGCGREVRFVIALDTDTTGIDYDGVPVSAVAPRRPGDAVARWLRGLWRRDWPRLVQALLSARFFARPIGRRLVRAAAISRLPLPRGLAFVARLQSTVRLFSDLRARWFDAGGRARADLPVVLFRSQAPRPGTPEDLGWGARTGRLTIVAVPGDHSTMLTGEAGAALCERIAALID